MKKNKLSDYLYLYRWLIGRIGREVGLHRAFKGIWCCTLSFPHNGELYCMDVSFDIRQLMMLNLTNDGIIDYMNRTIHDAVVELKFAAYKNELAETRDLVSMK